MSVLEQEKDNKGPGAYGHHGAPTGAQGHKPRGAHGDPPGGGGRPGACG